MKKILFFLLTMPLVMYRVVAADKPEEISKLWKERGYVAISRLEDLLNKDDVKSQYEYLLEYAFAMHAAANNSEEFRFVHKNENDVDFYKIVLNKAKNPDTKTGVDEAGLFIINYTYDHKTGEFIGIKLELLPQGWYLHTNPKLPNTFLLDVNNDGIVIVFDLTNPMNTQVIKVSE